MGKKPNRTRTADQRTHRIYLGKTVFQRFRCETPLRDTGIGIATHDLERVFDMFSQAPHSIGISKGGLGIGLSLVRRRSTHRWSDKWVF